MKIKSHSESHIVELDDGSRWQIFPGDLDVTLNWKPETELTVVPSDDDVSSHMLMGEGAKVHVRCRRKLARQASEVGLEGRLGVWRYATLAAALPARRWIDPAAGLRLPHGRKPRPLAGLALELDGPGLFHASPDCP